MKEYKTVIKPVSCYALKKGDAVAVKDFVEELNRLSKDKVGRQVLQYYKRRAR